MSATRCPSCAAAVRVDDPWCTLCYADLRAPEAPVESPESMPEAVLESVLETVPPGPSAPYSPHAEPLLLDPADPLGSATPTPLPTAAMPTWECVSCGQRNSYDDLTCFTCGRALLADDATLPALIKPGSSTSKAAFIFGGMLAVMAVMLVVFFLVGSFL